MHNDTALAEGFAETGRKKARRGGSGVSGEKMATPKTSVACGVAARAVRSGGKGERVSGGAAFSS